MFKQRIEKLDVTVSRLGFGIMRLPLLPDGKIDRAQAIKLVDTAYQSGVNYFDTAYAYHEEESEPFLCEALANYPRESYLIADKLPSFLCKEEADIERFFAEQLARLNTTYFDFYMFHALGRDNWDTMVRFNALEKLLQKKKDGQIRRLGFSYHGDFETFCEILDVYDWDFVQLQLNYIDFTHIEMQPFYDLLCKKGIPCIVMEPVRGGFLATPPQVAVDLLAAHNPARSAVDWAFRWCISLENAPVILSGMSTMEQVRENIEIFSDPTPLTAEEFALLDRARDVICAIKSIPCTGCGYCMDCPCGVAIPQVMHSYNQYKLFDNRYRLNEEYKSFGAAGWESCTACGVCVGRCPQGLDIPRHMREIGEEFNAEVRF